MKFVEKKFDGGLAEIPQTFDVKFAFVYRNSDGSYSNQMPFVKCRDFLGDAISAVQDKQTKSIYGFSWNPKKQKMYSNKLMLVVKFPEVGHTDDFITNHCCMGQNYLANLSGVSFGKVTKIDEQTLIIEAPKFWKQSVAAISFYTYCLKCFSYKLDLKKPFVDAVLETKCESVEWDGTKKVRKTLEAVYMEDIKVHFALFTSLLKNMTKKLSTVHGYPVGSSINKVHNNSGFISVIRWRTGDVGTRFSNFT